MTTSQLIFQCDIKWYDPARKWAVDFRKDLRFLTYVLWFFLKVGCLYPFVFSFKTTNHKLWVRIFAIFGAPCGIDWKHSCDVRSGANWHANAWQWDKRSCQLTWMVLMSPGFAEGHIFVFSHGPWGKCSIDTFTF